jgi:hypothetical protein
MDWESMGAGWRAADTVPNVIVSAKIRSIRISDFRTSGYIFSTIQFPITHFVLGKIERRSQYGINKVVSVQFWNDLDFLG